MLVTLLMCQLMIVLDMTVMNVALPHIQSDLGFSAAGLSWVVDGYTLVFGGLLLLGGRAGDLFGRRRILLVGVTLFTLASLFGGFADSAASLLSARVLQGVGAAMAGPSALALLTTTFTDHNTRTRALAWYSGAASGGVAIGLVLGGLLTQWLSWRSVLFINVPLGFAVVASVARHLREPERRPARLDLPGALTATAGVAGLVYGFIRAATAGWGDTMTLASLALGAVLIVAFFVIETHTDEPLIPMRLFADRNRATAYVVFFIGPMAGMSMFFFLTQYLQDIRGMSALGAGFAFLPMALCTFGLSRFVPRLLPRFGPKVMATSGACCMIVGVVLLSRLSTSTSYFPMIFVAMLLMGIGMGLAFSPLNVIIMATVRSADAGAAGGVLQTMQQTGGALGLAILVTVFGTATRTATGSPHHILVTGITSAFVAATVIATLTFLVALTFRKVR